MKTSFAVVASAVVALAVFPLWADDAPRLQVFGGYSVGSIQAPYQGASLYRGWNASVEQRVFWKISAVADFAGHYGTENELVKNRIHSASFGPKLTLRNGRISPFVHALFGASRMSADAGGPAFTSTSFTMTAGCGVDYRITPRLAVRLFQADYVKRQFFGEAPHGARFSAGVVLRLGGE
jgi:hypothetical protein